MELNRLDSTTIKRFKYFMAFFEYGSFLRDSELVSRRLKAPSFEDMGSIKKRLATIILKGLRTEGIYNVGDTFSNDDLMMRINNVSRVRNNNSDLSRYMQFILDLDITAALPQLIPVDDNGNFQFKLASIGIRDTVFDNCIYRPCAEDTSMFEKRELFVQWMKDNYEVGAIPVLRNSNSLVVNPISEISRNDLGRMSFEPREVSLSYMQRWIFDRLSHRYSSEGKIKMFDVLDNILNRSSASMVRSGRTVDLHGASSQLFPGDILLSEPTEWPAMFGSNLVIPLDGNRTRSYSESRRTSGCLILCKKNIDDGGATNIVPNLIDMNYKLSLNFNESMIMNPEEFFRANTLLIDRIKRSVSGE